MTFKVRDLLISIAPESRADDCTNDTRCNGCTNQYSDCDGGCSNARSDYSENCPKWRLDPADLVELNELLRYAMARTEVASLEAKMESQALEHLDEIESRIRQALEEVRVSAKSQVKQTKRAAGLRGGAFRVQDLMISVLPRGLGDDGASGCPACTCNAGCSSSESSCTNTSGRWDFLDWNQAEVLPELRGLLGQALSRVGGPSQRPAAQSPDDLARLEKGLTDALEAIERRRANKG